MGLQWVYYVDIVKTFAHVYLQFLLLHQLHAERDAKFDRPT